MKVIYVGTLHPAHPGGWWPRMIATGSIGTTYVQALQGDSEKWDSWPEIRRCNPLTAISDKFRAKLREEREEARSDTRLKARFLNLRLNRMSGDESVVLLTAEDWTAVVKRPVPEVNGSPPIVGIDLGQNRAWCAAVAVWKSGRTEAIAVAPGIPSLREQEKRDRQPGGTYQRLADSGQLLIAEDVHVPDPRILTEHVAACWNPRYVMCDFFRVGELKDAMPAKIRIVPRRTQYSFASEDIRALRKMAKDGPLAVEPGSRPLIRASLFVTRVKNDDAGNTKISKKPNNTARDDVSSALTLAAGAVSRSKPRKPGSIAVPGGGKK